MLRWLGHEAVAVLDGGFVAWRGEARPVTTSVPRIAPTRYPGKPRADAAVDAARIVAHIGRPDVLVVDARSAERFRGELEPIDPVAGRIPGSRNRFCGLNLAPDGRFKDATTLRSEFGALVITSYSIHYTKLYDEWRVLRPAEVAVAGAHGDVAVAERAVV